MPPQRSIFGALFVFFSCLLLTPLHGKVAERVSLESGILVIPDAAKEGPDPVPLTVHLHGAVESVEQSFLNAKAPGVLLVVNRPGLSSAYRDFFSDPERWDELIRSVSDEVGSHTRKSTAVGTVTLSSFSAGFGGVRELLRQDTPRASVRTLLLIDSLHAGFTGDPAERSINPDHMAPFVRFAEEARRGDRNLFMTHSEVATPGYASTSETARYLIDRLGGEAEGRKHAWTESLVSTSEYRNGNVTLIGFRGASAEDHLAHLRNLNLFFRAAGNEKPEGTAGSQDP